MLTVTSIPPPVLSAMVILPTVSILLSVISVLAKDNGLLPANSVVTPEPHERRMVNLSKRASIDCSQEESTISEPDFEFLVGLFCNNLWNIDGKMDEPYEWTYILNKAEHTFSILFQSGCYSHPDIFSVLASTCMGELRAIWHKCEFHVCHDAIADLM